MEEQIKKRIPQMVELLKHDYDIIIKKSADETIKVMYYKPKKVRDE